MPRSVVATVAIQVDPSSADAFDIDTRISGTVTPSQTAVIESAVSKWEQIIVNGAATGSIDPDSCQGLMPPAGAIDDMFLDVVVRPSDGVGGQIGEAVVCQYRVASGVFGVPEYTVIVLDSDDIASQEAAGRLYSVVLHELAHGLGFGESVKWQRPTNDPLSRMTIASMRDIGYTVDLGQADAYALSAGN